jgi:hypothetical protein
MQEAPPLPQSRAHSTAARITGHPSQPSQLWAGRCCPAKTRARPKQKASGKISEILRRTNYNNTFLYYLLSQLTPATYFLEINPLSANRPGLRLSADVPSADWLIIGSSLPRAISSLSSKAIAE